MCCLLFVVWCLLFVVRCSLIVFGCRCSGSLHVVCFVSVLFVDCLLVVVCVLCGVRCSLLVACSARCLTFDVC